MSAKALLLSLFQYKAWADEELIAGLKELEARPPSAEFFTAIRIFNHAHVVDRIFAANLLRAKHNYETTESIGIPEPASLFNAIQETGHWYIGYVACLSEPKFTEAIEFAFTDGTPGRMTREEMLAHIIAHSSYHRGEVGRIMTQLTASSPRDTFTGYLHEAEPARRERM